VENERALGDAINIEGGVRNKIYKDLAEELIKTLRHG